MPVVTAPRRRLVQHLAGGPSKSADPSPSLRHRPPVMSNPTIIEVDETTCTHVGGPAPGSVTATAIHGAGGIGDSPSRAGDLLVKYGGAAPLDRQIAIRYWHRVRLVGYAAAYDGGEFDDNMANSMLTIEDIGALGDPGSVFIEGLHIDGGHHYHNADALAFRRLQLNSFTVQNSRVEGIGGPIHNSEDPDILNNLKRYHPDVMQFQAGAPWSWLDPPKIHCGNVNIEGVYIEWNYQGIFANQDQRMPEGSEPETWNIRNFHSVAGIPEAAGHLWLEGVDPAYGGSHALPTVVFDGVYLDGANTGKANYVLLAPQRLYANPTDTSTPVAAAGAPVTGMWQRGAPPEPIAPASSVGTNYTSPWSVPG
jgi:hypothetical protein